MPTGNAFASCPFIPVTVSFHVLDCACVGKTTMANRIVVNSFFIRFSSVILVAKIGKISVPCNQSIKFLQKNTGKVLLVPKKAVPLHPQNRIGVWCNGNTTDSGPVILGSSPSTPTKKTAKSLVVSAWRFSYFLSIPC